MHGKRTALLVTVAALIGFMFMLLRYPAGNPDWLPRCLNSGLIALETAVSPAEVLEIWHQSDFKRQNVEPNLEWDFGFMAAYGLLFVQMALLGRKRGVRVASIAATLAVVTAIAAAGSDARENLMTLKSVPLLIHDKLPDAETVAQARTASLAKWGLTGVTLLLLWGAVVPSRSGPASYRVIAWGVEFFMALSGVLGVIGVVDNTKLELVIPLLLPALVGFAVIVWRYWGVHAPS
jgi:hypothetical protein